MKDHVTLNTGVMILDNQLCHHRNKLHFKIYSNTVEDSYSKL